MGGEPALSRVRVVSVAGWLDAMRSDLPPAFRLVWQCLESHANSSRWWEIRDADIAAELRLAKDTVGRAISRLERDGIIRAVRRKRLPTRYHMLRVYACKSRSDDFATIAGLSPEIVDPTAELTPQNVDSTAVSDPELSPENVDSSAELSPENVDSLSPTESNRKKASPPFSPRGEKTRRKVLLPKEWGPSEEAFALGRSLGMGRSQVQGAADQMRDKMTHTLERGADWDARFLGWLRVAARTSSSPRPAARRGYTREFLARLEAGGDDGSSAVECAA